MGQLPKWVMNKRVEQQNMMYLANEMCYRFGILDLGKLLNEINVKQRY